MAWDAQPAARIQPPNVFYPALTAHQKVQETLMNELTLHWTINNSETDYNPK